MQYYDTTILYYITPEQILRWRDDTAKALRMAPAAVIAEHITLTLAYSRPTGECQV